MEDSKKTIFIYPVIIFLALFLGSGIFLIFNNNSVTQKTADNTTSIKEEKLAIPTSSPKSGSMTLGFDGQDSSFTVQQEIPLILTATSTNKTISGFDIVLYYDKDQLEFVSAQSVLTGYDIYTYKKDNYLTITGVKSPQNQNLVTFDQTKLIKFIFKGKKVGAQSVSLREGVGVEKTKFVTDTTEVIFPAVSDLALTIK